MSNVTRRSFLRATAAAPLLLSGVGKVWAETRAIAATTPPGAWEEAQRGILLPAFRRATQASVNLIGIQPLDTLSKVIASKVNPPFDVIMLDEGPYLAALNQDIFEKIPVVKVPELKNVPKNLIDPHGLGVFISGQIIGIAYNTERIKTPPHSWNDLLKPEYKGRVGLAGMGSTLMGAWMVEIARLNGGSEENMEPAFQFLKKLMPNLSAVANSPGALATLFQQDQIDIAVHYNNNIGDLQGKGVPVALAKPDTGWIYIRTGMHIVKNSKNVDLAAAYINAALSAEVQTQMAAAPYFIVPVNMQAKFSAGLQTYAKNANDLQTMKTVDWAKLNPRRAEYIDRFNREVHV
jgi:putative spermidine/putrescine transport system substrate-binding protein